MAAGAGRPANALWARHQWAGQAHAGGGPLDLCDPRTRSRVLDPDRALLRLGFAGVHYDIEPVHPGDRDFPDLLTRPHEPTRAVTVFVGVPTYRTPTPGRRICPPRRAAYGRGIDALRHPPRRAHGVAVHAEWTTGERD